MTTISNSNFNYDNMEPNSNKSETQSVKKEDSTSVFSVYDFNKDSKVSVAEQKQVINNILSNLVGRFANLCEKYGVSESEFIDNAGLSDISTDGSKESANAADAKVNQAISDAKDSFAVEIEKLNKSEMRKNTIKSLQLLEDLSNNYKASTNPNDKEAFSNSIKSTIKGLEIRKNNNLSGGFSDMIGTALEELYAEFPEFKPKEENK